MVMTQVSTKIKIVSSFPIYEETLDGNDEATVENVSVSLYKVVTFYLETTLLADIVRDASGKEFILSIGRLRKWFNDEVPVAVVNWR